MDSFSSIHPPAEIRCLYRHVALDSSAVNDSYNSSNNNNSTNSETSNHQDSSLPQESPLSSPASSPRALWYGEDANRADGLEEEARGDDNGNEHDNDRGYRNNAESTETYPPVGDSRQRRRDDEDNDISSDLHRAHPGSLWDEEPPEPVVSDHEREGEKQLQPRLSQRRGGGEGEGAVRRKNKPTTQPSTSAPVAILIPPSTPQSGVAPFDEATPLQNPNNNTNTAATTTSANERTNLVPAFLSLPGLPPKAPPLLPPAPSNWRLSHSKDGRNDMIEPPALSLSPRMQYLRKDHGMTDGERTTVTTTASISTTGMMDEDVIAPFPASAAVGPPVNILMAATTTTTTTTAATTTTTTSHPSTLLDESRPLDEFDELMNPVAAYDVSLTSGTIHAHPLHPELSTLRDHTMSSVTDSVVQEEEEDQPPPIIRDDPKDRITTGITAAATAAASGRRVNPRSNMISSNDTGDSSTDSSHRHPPQSQQRFTEDELPHDERTDRLISPSHRCTPDVSMERTIGFEAVLLQDSQRNVTMDTTFARKIHHNHHLTPHKTMTANHRKKNKTSIMRSVVRDRRYLPYHDAKSDDSGEEADYSASHGDDDDILSDSVKGSKGKLMGFLNGGAREVDDDNDDDDDTQPLLLRPSPSMGEEEQLRQRHLYYQRLQQGQNEQNPADVKEGNNFSIKALEDGFAPHQHYKHDGIRWRTNTPTFEESQQSSLISPPEPVQTPPLVNTMDQGDVSTNFCEAKTTKRGWFDREPSSHSNVVKSKSDSSSDFGPQVIRRDFSSAIDAGSEDIIQTAFATSPAKSIVDGRKTNKAGAEDDPIHSGIVQPQSSPWDVEVSYLPSLSEPPLLRRLSPNPLTGDSVEEEPPSLRRLEEERGTSFSQEVFPVPATTSYSDSRVSRPDPEATYDEPIESDSDSTRNLIDRIQDMVDDLSAMAHGRTPSTSIAQSGIQARTPHTESRHSSSRGSHNDPEPLHDGLPALINCLDSDVGIPKGDVFISLLNDDPHWASRITEAVWRNRLVRRGSDTAYLKGKVSRKKGDPGLGRTSVLVDADEGRVLESTSVSDTQAAAIQHLKYDEVPDALDLYEDILERYYHFSEELLNKGLEERWFEFLPYIGIALYDIGIVQMLVGDFESACQNFERALHNLERMQGRGRSNEHLEHSVLLSHLAVSYCALNNFGRATEIFREALSMARDRLATLPDRRHCSETLNNLGCLYFRAGEAKAAISCFQESLELQMAISEDSLYVGSKFSCHSSAMSVAIVRANLGFLAVASKDLSRARIAMESSLKTQILLLRDAHITVVSTMENLALIHLLGNNRDKALQLLRRILNMQLDAFGPSDSRCGETSRKILMIEGSDGKEFSAFRTIPTLERVVEQPPTDRDTNKSTLFKAFNSIRKWNKS